MNDYQLKGKTEVAYWPKLREFLKRHRVPESSEDLVLLELKLRIL